MDGQYDPQSLLDSVRAPPIMTTSNRADLNEQCTSKVCALIHLQITEMQIGIILSNSSFNDCFGLGRQMTIGDVVSVKHKNDVKFGN